MIEGIKMALLREVLDEDGKIMQKLRRDAPCFTRFGDIHFSSCV